ncbi:hypothetical protein F511_44383 [Dorcoceras hygrometricum]|uniref:Uncharacterized protein n=1 Tax=Dorcoceras hygrometricum TaxID=472368 RepID=A0A2Z7BS84_9LAMI|nr:hypothetical protein F511_44383 [Dorcoceras hygrometricum]
MTTIVGLIVPSWSGLVCRAGRAYGAELVGLSVPSWSGLVCRAGRAYRLPSWLDLQFPEQSWSRQQIRELRDSGLLSRDNGLLSRDNGNPSRDNGLLSRDNGHPSRDNGHPSISDLVPTGFGFACIQDAEDTIQEQHLVIEALVEEKSSLLQTIQGLQEDNDDPAPFDDEWEEEPEEDPKEEGLEDIPIGEGDIVDE